MLFPDLIQVIGPIPAGERKAFLGVSGLCTRCSGIGVRGLEYVGGGGTKAPKRYSAFEGGSLGVLGGFWLCEWSVQHLWL